MNDDHFDKLTRRFATHRPNRRQVLRAAAATGAAAVLSDVAGPTIPNSRHAIAQNETRRLAGQPDVAKIAFDLQYDLHSIFDFVATDIRYEPYSGVLRGPVGTLWGKAGNSADQALLLQALLTEANISSQLVVGAIDITTSAALQSATELTLDEWSKSFVAAIGEDSLSESDAPIPGTPVAVIVDDLVTKATAHQQELHDTVLSQLQDQTALITSQLKTAGISVARPTVTLPVREQERHVWVQAAHGNEWLDLDPSVPGATFGKAYGTEPTVITAFDPGEYHQVKFRAIGDVIRGGSVTQEEWLTYTANSAELVGQPINFFHVKPASLGASIDQSLGGTDQYEAFLQVGTTSTEGKPFIFTGQNGGGVIGALGGDQSKEGEPVAEWLEISVISPDAEPIVETRAIFDRIGDAARLDGTVDKVAADLEPIETYTFEEKDIGPYFLPLVGVVNLAVVSASVPAVFFKQDWSVPDIAGDLSFQNHAFHFVRDGLSHGLADETGLRFIRDRPTITGTWVAIVLRDEKLASTVSFDLIQATTSARAIKGMSPMAIPGIAEGVINQVCERNFFEIGAKTVANILGSDYISVGRIMETADQQGTPIVTLTPNATIPDDVSGSISAAARVQIEKYLGAGYAVVVPSGPIGLGSASVTGFWAIDPVTGRTIDRLENGAGSELPEEATLLDIVIHTVHEAYVLGTCVVGLCFAAAALISMAIWGYSGGLLAGAVGGAVHGGGFCLAAASGAGMF